MKVCFKCGETKPLAEYYAHKQMADGHLNKCKICTKKDANKHRAENLEYCKDYDRKRIDQPSRIAKRKEIAERWKNDPELKEKMRLSRIVWLEKNTIKRAAHIITGNAIRDGKLVKQPCIVCGEDAEAHHEDYNYPMDVVWYCKKHHGERHRQINEERRKNKPCNPSFS